MTFDEPQVDPEVLALLDEVISDPASALLRRPETRLDRVLGLREAPISQNSAFLNKLERHLLMRNAEELASLLFDASEASLRRPSCSTPRLHWEREVPADLESRVKFIHPSPHSSERGMIDRFLASASRSPTASELAAASLRLVPRDRTRIQLALALELESKRSQACDVLTDVLAHRPSARDESVARSNFGFFLASAGQQEEARNWHREASLISGARPFSFLGWLVLAISAGEMKEACEADDRMSDAIPQDHHEVGEAVAALQADVREGFWKPSASAVRLADRLRDSGSPIARMLADVIR